MNTNDKQVHPSHSDILSTDMIGDYDAYRNFLIRKSSTTDESALNLATIEKPRIPLPASFLPPKIPNTGEYFFAPPIDPTTNNFYDGNGFSNILFSRLFFRVIKQLDTTAFQRKRGGALIQCCFCECKLKGSTQVTSNLIRHLKIKHPEAFEEYKRLKAINSN